jgi:hypothetical protein
MFHRSCEKVGKQLVNFIGGEGGRGISRESEYQPRPGGGSRLWLRRQEAS